MSEAENLGVNDDLDLSWMDQTGPWDTRAEESSHGLTLADIQVGEYGQVPDESDNQTGRPRGAAARSGAYRIGTTRFVPKVRFGLITLVFCMKRRSSASGAPQPMFLGTRSSRSLTILSKLSAKWPRFLRKWNLLPATFPPGGFRRRRPIFLRHASY